MLEKTTRFILLYDFYQDLLTKKQKQYAELYFQDDLSLGEIAEEYDISRQAVYEHIKRAEKLLEDYEENLQLLSKHERRKVILDEMEEYLRNSNNNDKNLLDKIAELRRTE